MSLNSRLRRQGNGVLRAARRLREGGRLLVVVVALLHEGVLERVRAVGRFRGGPLGALDERDGRLRDIL